MKSLAYIFPIVVLIFLIIFSMSGEDQINSADENVKKITKNFVLKSDENKLSYALGNQVAKGIEAQSKNTKLDVDIVIQAISDVLKKDQELLSGEEVKAELVKWQQSQMAALEEASNQNKKKGEEFLAKNKDAEGVFSTKSGLQYQILEEGSGKTPTEDSLVKVHYVGTLLDGTEFDSSYKREKPLTFNLKQVIPGWTEGLQKVKEGGKLKLFIPPHLAYGAQDRPSIPGNSTLIFDVELLEVVK